MKVSRGSTRIVVLVGRWAIKFPSTYSYRHFLQGLLANEQETAWYKAFASSNKLCPVLFTFPGCLFIVMPRAKILTRHEFLDLQHTIDYFRWFVYDESQIPAELKHDSFGWLNSQLVAVDYGS